MIFKIVVVAAAACFVCTVAQDEPVRRERHPYSFPEDFGSCDVQSANASNCMRDLVQNAMTMLGREGINHPINYTLNPMILNFWIYNMRMDFLNNSEYFWDLTFPTFWNSTVLSASYNPENYTLTYTAYNSHIVESGTYDIFGLISFEDGSTDVLYGRGPFNKHLYGVTFTHRITFVPVHRQGIEYMHIRDYIIDVDGFTDARYYYNHMYDGNATLANKAENRMNRNSVAMVISQADQFNAMMVTIFRLYTQRLISSVPRSELRRHLFRQA